MPRAFHKRDSRFWRLCLTLLRLVEGPWTVDCVDRGLESLKGGRARSRMPAPPPKALYPCLSLCNISSPLLLLLSASVRRIITPLSCGSNSIALFYYLHRCFGQFGRPSLFPAVIHLPSGPLFSFFSRLSSLNLVPSILAVALGIDSIEHTD